MEDYSADLRTTASKLWRRKMIVLTVMLAITSAVVMYAISQPNVYAAKAQLVLRPVISSIAVPSAAGAKSGPLGLDLTAESQAEVIGSTLIAERVVRELGLTASPERVSRLVSVTDVTDELLEITAYARTPGGAATLANAFATEFLSYRRDQAGTHLSEMAAQVARRLQRTESRIGRLDRLILALIRRGRQGSEVARLTAERNELIAQAAVSHSRLEDLRAGEISNTGGGEIIDPAVPREDPASPKPVRAGVVGLVFGLVLGVAAGLLRDAFDRKLRTHAEFAQAVGRPIYGIIPRGKRRRKGASLVTLEDPSSATAESYRMLRQTLLARGVGGSLKSIVVTSAGPGEGKSSTVANLGVSLAQSGLKVVLVAADLRSPRLHDFFGKASGPGLSEALADETPIGDVVLPTKVPGLKLLLPGATPANPAGLFDRPHLDRIVDELRAMADVVIFDVPPLSSGADAVVLAPRAAATVLLLRHGVATEAGTTSSIGDLQRVGVAEILPVVTFATADATLDAGMRAYAAYGDRNGGNGHMVSAPVQVVAPNADELQRAAADLAAASLAPARPRQRTNGSTRKTGPTARDGIQDA